MEEPILWYPYLNEAYTYLDASKYASACIFTQVFEHKIENTQVPKTSLIYQSGLFKDSQLNWATITIAIFVKYVKKMAHYLEDGYITLKSYHLPLIKFLQRYTLTTKINNWTVEI